MSEWTTKLRKPALGLTLASALATALPLQAAEVGGASNVTRPASKQENIGVFSGLVIGALAGGPFGAIAGAATGAWLGERYHRQSEEKKALTASLGRNEAERARLQAELAEMRSQGLLMGEALDRTDRLETIVAFRTGDATISEEDAARLRKVGALAGALGQVKVYVAGYADPRGPEHLNAQLSEERANAVAHVLMAAGVDPSRLEVEAHGESTSTSAEGDVDGYAFDRRVVVRIEQPEGGLAAYFRK
jgi:outer membrane protein OmpA-like peptidoglycan-associated protein